MPILAFLALLLLSLPGAAVQADARIPSRIVWIIHPEPLPAQTQQSVGNRTTLLSAPLRPERLFRLEADAITPGGAVLLKRGAQLVAAQSSAIIACSPDKAPRRGLFSALDVTRDHFQCLVGQGRTPGRTDPVTPVAYAEESPDMLRAGPRLHAQYSAYSGIADALVFESCFRPNDPAGESCFETHSLKTEDVPGVIRAHGAEIRVEARERPGVRVTILSNFAPGPLFVDPNEGWQ